MDILRSSLPLNRLSAVHLTSAGDFEPGTSHAPRSISTNSPNPDRHPFAHSPQSHADGEAKPHASPPTPLDAASGLSAVGSSAAAASMALGGHLPPPPPSSAHVSSL